MWIQVHPKLTGRVEAIKHYMAHCNLLDVGSSDMDGLGSLNKDIKKAAKSVTSVDIQNGQNFETYKLGRKFDCIVAGDIIEHIDNTGKFLNNCRRHLIDNGRLIITTPNPYGIYRVLRHIAFGRYMADETDNPAEHTQMFTFALLERLLKRHGFDVEEKLYVNHEKYGKTRIERFRNTLFMVAKKV